MSKQQFKFHPKHMAWLMPLILSGMMSSTISMINLLKSVGWVDGFFQIWLKSWLISWLIAFPLILIFLPIVRKILMNFVATPDE